MPELPEVETIKNQLAKNILGTELVKIEVGKPKMLNVSVSDFQDAIQGAFILDIRRRAKLLIFDFSNDWSVVVHLKMAGQLLYGTKKGIGKPHIVYTFRDGSQLKHHDFRIFGYAKLFEKEKINDFIREINLGPEILENNFTANNFKELLGKRKNARIKPLLMDQKFIAGVGNIYAQEACFCAKINPWRKAGELTDFQTEKLYQCLIDVLEKAIKDKGTSFDDAYVDVAGEKGRYASRLKVYGRGGKKCFNCKSEIETVKLGGRGTSFCSICQK